MYKPNQPILKYTPMKQSPRPSQPQSIRSKRTIDLDLDLRVEDTSRSNLFGHGLALALGVALGLFIPSLAFFFVHLDGMGWEIHTSQ